MSKGGIQSVPPTPPPPPPPPPRPLPFCKKPKFKLYCYIVLIRYIDDFYRESSL